jgi:hypothetical protein
MIIERVDTVKRLKEAIAEVNTVMVFARFGFAETYVKIPKGEARFLIKNMGNTTPDEYNMGTGYFGTIHEADGKTTLILG